MNLLNFIKNFLSISLPTVGRHVAKFGIFEQQGFWFFCGLRSFGKRLASRRITGDFTRPGGINCQDFSKVKIFLALQAKRFRRCESGDIYVASVQEKCSEQNGRHYFSGARSVATISWGPVHTVVARVPTIVISVIAWLRTANVNMFVAGAKRSRTGDASGFVNRCGRRNAIYVGIAFFSADVRATIVQSCEN